MSKLGDLAHRAASLVVDQDEEQKPAPKPVAPVSSHPAFNLAPNTFSAAAPAPAVSGSPFAVPGTQVVDEGTYQSILKKTNFDTTPVGTAIHKYYDALEGTGMAVDQRFKAAMKQAAALDGISADKVLATFDQMESALEADANGFQGVADSVEKNQITARQDKITALTQQVQAINAQIAQLQGELTDQTTGHANAVQQYGLASSKRAQEIAAQKSQFAALLH